MFRCLQKVSSKITFLRQSIRAAFLLDLGPFWLYEEVDDRYPKEAHVGTQIDISGHIWLSIYISLKIYGLGFGCKNSLKKLPLLYQKWEFYDTPIFLQELLNN